jgi:hypothetical protein
MRMMMMLMMRMVCNPRKYRLIIFKDVPPKDIKSQLLSLIVMAELPRATSGQRLIQSQVIFRGMDPLGFGDQGWIKRGQEQA